MLQVIETALVSKAGAPDGGEDRLLVSDAFWAIADGATAKSEQTYGGRTGGQLVAETIVDVLQSLDPDCSGAEAVAAFDRAVRAAIEASGHDPDALPVDRPCASVSVYSRQRAEIWRVGDTHFRIDRVAHKGHKRTDAVAAAARSAILHTYRVEGRDWASLAGEDPGRDAILPLLRRQSVFMNNPDAGDWAFGAIDGSGRSETFLEVLDVAGAAEIVLCSDGYLDFSGTLAEAEAHLAGVLERDPGLFVESLQTKGILPGRTSFDDRSFLRAIAG